MKQIKFTLVLIFSVSCIINTFSGSFNNNIPEEIKMAFKAGNSKVLAKYFNSNIELVVLDNEDVYSKAQAEQIVKNFFIKYPPNDFIILHQGGKEESKYAIGSLTTDKKSFRIYFLIKIKNDLSYIHQLRIEEENVK